MSPRNGVTIPMGSQPQQWHVMKLQRNLSTPTSAAHRLAAHGPAPEAREDPHVSRRQQAPTIAVRNQDRSTGCTPMAILTSITTKPLRTSTTPPRAPPPRHPTRNQPMAMNSPARTQTSSLTLTRLGQLVVADDGHNAVAQGAWKSSDSMTTDPGGRINPRPKDHRQLTITNTAVVVRPAQAMTTTVRTTITHPMVTLDPHPTMKTHSYNTPTANPVLVAVGKL